MYVYMCARVIPIALRLPSQVPFSSQTEEQSRLKSNMYVYMCAREISIVLRLPSQVSLSSQTEERSRLKSDMHVCHE